MSIDRPTSSEPSLPGSIRAAIPHPSGGRIVMAGFPGLEIGVDGEAVFLPEACFETLEGLKTLGADRLTLLVERDELETGFFEGIEQAAMTVGLSLSWFPIVDYAVPSDTAKAAWARKGPYRAELLATGGAVAFACQYGAGRSGLMAAWVLVEGGARPDEAIATVRSYFPEAVESEAQEDWVRALG